MKKLLFSTILLSSVFSNIAFAENEAQPYYFSNELKQAIQNCSSYTEDIFEKNPEMKETATSMMSMFFDNFDSSSAKMLLTVQGLKENQCQLSIKYDYQLPMSQQFDCFLSHEDQTKLLNAMNDKSTEKKTRTFGKNGFSTTMTDREFNLTLSEITNTSCREHEPTEDEQAELEEKTKETVHKMLAFSEQFKNSLKSCTPDKNTIGVMGIEVNEVEIKGKEQGKCHITSHGFHILLNDNELSLSGFDELAKLLTDETRAIYNPTYKFRGILLALAECDALRKLNKESSRMSNNQETMSLGNEITIQQGVNQSYTNGMCKILINQVMNRNRSEKDYSLRCDVSNNNMSKILQHYTNILKGNLPEKTDHSYSSGHQTEEMTMADKEIFIQLYKNKICKSIELYPATTSPGCPDSKPLKDRDGECHSCNEIDEINLGMKNEKDCSSVCDGSHGRSKRKVEHFSECILASCPTDKPLKDSWGKCHGCDFEGILEDENCSMCKNRKVKNGKCIISNCVNRPLKDTEGNCYSCNTEESVSVLNGQCTSVCPNRRESGNWSAGDISGVFCDK